MTHWNDGKKNFGFLDRDFEQESNLLRMLFLKAHFSCAVECGLGRVRLTRKLNQMVKLGFGEGSKNAMKWMHLKDI